MAKVVSREEWLRAREALLVEEKAHFHAGDAIAAKRRALPWVALTKPYIFDGPSGAVSMRDLFGRASQLVVYHFMFPPEDTEGCKHCSFWADHYSGAVVHLAHRDAAFAAISRAPIDRIAAFKARMGWTFPWVSSGASEFNYDFNVSFTDAQLKNDDVVYNYRREPEMDMHDREGISVFARDGKDIFHTYSTFARGIEPANATYAFLDMLPNGRDEGDAPQSWVRYHDRYED